MENINTKLNSSETQEIKNENQIFKENTNPIKEEQKNNNVIEINEPLESRKQTADNFNIKNKYDYALLEELNNTKMKSWRNDLINATQEEEKENKNISKENVLNNNEKIINEEKEKNEINKVDRFKDFDDILLLEENMDKKKKNILKVKSAPAEKSEKIQSNNKNEKDKENINQRLIKENNNINRNSSTISELNKYIENRDTNNIENLENNNNIINDNDKNSIINFKNHKKSSNLTIVINENTNNSIEKNNNNSIYKNINLEYSEDKKSYEQIDQNNIKIINHIKENSKNNEKKIDSLYNNFFNRYDKEKYNNDENDKYTNRLNRNLFGQNNKKEINEYNNKKTSKNFHVSKSCNYLHKNRKSNNENIFIFPNKSQNIRRNLIYDKNTINIQLSINRKTRSANDIKKQMSYYLMDGINKNTKSEVNKFEEYINKVQSKYNYNSNNRLLNSFLSLQVSSNKINSKNNINYINTPYNICKNSFSDKIRKKMKNINANKKYKNHNYKPKNKYINLEFFEESKQDNFFDKTSKNNLLFKNQKRNNFLISQNNYFQSEKNHQNNMFFSYSNISQKKDYKNNYLFKNYSTNMNQKKTRSYFSHENKSNDFYQEKNEIFGANFNYNINPIRKFEFNYNDSNSDKLFNTTKNILYPKMPSSRSSNAIFHGSRNDKDKSIYSHLYNSNNNKMSYRSNISGRNTNIFYANF